MVRNVGTIDRMIRVAAGATFVALALAGVVDAWGYIGIVPLLTGVFGACPPTGSSGSAPVFRRRLERVIQKLWIVIASLALLGAALLWLGFKVLILWLTRRD